MGRHRKTLEAIFTDPPPANLKWTAIEAMLRNMGAEIDEGAGSRVRVVLHGRSAVFHRPHPQPEAKRSVIRTVRQFLNVVGIEP